MIVDTLDALPLANCDHAQDVGKVTEQPRLQDHETHKVHRAVPWPWDGRYTLPEDGPRPKIKCIEVKPGASLSLQIHFHPSEHWVVVTGTAKAVNGGEEIFLSANQSMYIAADSRHRLENPGREPVALIEVQCESYREVDNIVPFDDAYGRIKLAAKG